MTQEAAAILKQALALPPDERADLAESLILSLDPADAAALEAAWAKEIARRIEDLDAGRVQPISEEEFLKRLRKATE